MEKSPTFSETQLLTALYEICSSNADAEAKEESLELLCRFSGEKKFVLLLLTVITNENEDLSVRKYAATFLIKFIEGVNPLVRTMLHVFLNVMPIPEKTYSMRKGFLLFVEIISDTMHKPNHDYCHFLVRLMMKYLNTKNDVQLHELGAIILHALLKNLTTKLVPHAKNIAQGMQIILKRSKYALKHKPEKSYGLFFHTLMCAMVFGQHMSKLSVVLGPFRKSLEDILDLLKFIAAHGTDGHFNEVSELLKILLKYKRYLGKKWPIVFATFKIICRKKKNQDFARIKTLEILGNVISARKIYFQKPKIFYGLLLTVIGILCQEPKEKQNESLECQTHKLPTPISVAADLLQFIAIKFPRNKVSKTVVNIILSIMKDPAINQWQFRGCFLSLARISKTCGGYLNRKYSNELIIIFKGGFTDSSKYVRQAAVYAICKHISGFHIGCIGWLKQTFPSFLLNMGSFIRDLMMGNLHHPLHIETLFAIMKIFCTTLDIDLLPHLPMMMKLFELTLKHIKNNRVIVCTIQLLQRTILYVRSAFLPYFNTIIMISKTFITNWDTSDYDEIRPHIIELLTHIMLYVSPNILEFGGDNIIELVFVVLQIQHARTQLYGADLEFLQKYSPLRCSIFRFIQEISYTFHEAIAKYVPKLIGTLLGTIIAPKFFCSHDLELIVISQRRPGFVESPMSDSSKASTSFKISDNNETETAKFSMLHDSFTLNEEVLLAFMVLQTMTETCQSTLQPYIATIFLKLGQTLKYSNVELRKQIIYTLNKIMFSFMNDFQLNDGNFLDFFMAEVVDLYIFNMDISISEDIEINFIIVTECVRAFLYYVAIKEKHLKANCDDHTYLCHFMTQVFNIIASLPQEREYRREKDILLSQIIAFMTKLSTMCSTKRFNNYFTVYLTIFEAKFDMPLYRSPISDQKRCLAYKKLIEGVHLMEEDNNDNFERISFLLIEGLNDPVNSNRRVTAAGLGALIDHCSPQSVKTNKHILNVLWKKSKREKNNAVLDSIWYAMVLTINHNMWQQSIRKPLLQIIHLLPIRHVFEYNMIMVEFFEKLCLERPTDISHIVKDIYKCLLKLLEDDLETDKDPLYKRTLALAATLYSMHIEDLRQVSISPTTMQAILAACKNRTCLRAILR